MEFYNYVSLGISVNKEVSITQAHKYYLWHTYSQDKITNFLRKKRKTPRKFANFSKKREINDVFVSIYTVAKIRKQWYSIQTELTVFLMHSCRANNSFYIFTSLLKKKEGLPWWGSG